MRSIHPSRRRGNTAIVAIVVVLVLAIGAFVWYQTSKTSTATHQASTSDVATAPTISSADDLTTAETTLDETDVTVNATDEATLDGYLKEF